MDMLLDDRARQKRFAIKGIGTVKVWSSTFWLTYQRTLERFDIIALSAMGAPQTPPLKTHLMSFTSKGAIFREVKLSKIRARLRTP